MKILLVNSGIKGFPEGYMRGIINSLQNEFKEHVTEIWPQNLSPEVIDQYVPDLVFVFHGTYAKKDVIRYARKQGAITIIWIVEDPYEIDGHTSDFLDCYDYIFNTEIEAIPYYNRSNVFYLPWCNDCSLYRPMQVDKKYQSDLCLIGMGFKNRIEILNQIENTLKPLNVKLIGDWNTWGAKLKPTLQRFVLPVINDPIEVAKYYNGAKINLNIHRDPFDQDLNINSRKIPASSLNNRTFNIAGVAGFQIVDNTRKELEKFFVPEKEIVTFNDTHDLAQKINYYLQTSDLRKKIGLNAYHRTIRNHSFNDRMAKVLKTVLEGRLVIEGEPIYHIKKGKRHHIHSMEAFMAHKYRPNSEIKVSSQTLSLFKKGENIVLASIIILAYKNNDLTIQCIDSVLRHTKVDFELIVIDNDSNLRLPGDKYKEVKVVKNQTNVGFARGCNQGARLANGKYLVFLNNDTIVTPNWLNAMIKIWQSANDIGIVGSKLLFPDTGRIQHAGVCFKNQEPGHLYYNLDPKVANIHQVRECPAITGACMLIDKDLFWVVDGFDENYINGYEDVDLCLKVREKGYRVMYTPGSLVYHYGSKAPGRQKYDWRNLKLLKEKWSNSDLLNDI